jgi:hypothetical protein
MASLDLTAADAVLKQYYDGMMLSELAYTDHPLLAAMPKFDQFKGRNRPIPLRYGRPQAVGSRFATVQADASPSKFEDFLITVTNGKKYGVATIDGLTAEVSQGDKASFIDGLTSEIDGILMEVAREASRAIYRRSSAALAQIASVSTTSLTLKNIQEVVLFEVGMIVVAAATEGGALLDSGEEKAITGVNRNTGVLTAATNWDTISGIAADDWLFRTGDKAAAGGTTDSMSGLADWLLTANPGGSDSFFGVNRSVDSRLYGTYYNGASDSIEDALINGQSLACVEGGSVDCMFINNKNYRDLITALGSKAQYEQIQARSAEGKIAGIAFDAVVIHGDKGRIKVVPDPDCQLNTVYGLELKSWELNSVGPVPKILMLDGLRIQRQASADGYEVRTGYYAQPSCDAPGHNVRIALA